VREKAITWLRSLIRVDSCGLVRNGGPRSGHMKGEGTVYCTRHLTSRRATNMSCLEKRRRLCLNCGVNTCAGGNMSLSFQLSDPLGE
jgi:hypothetical protein